MHKQHAIFEPDEIFDIGTLAHIKSGNCGRALDGRRTPGFIESFDEDSAMFIWRITDFEDTGSCWEIPAEQISSYQFYKDSSLLSQEEICIIEERFKALNKPLLIPKTSAAHDETKKAVNLQKRSAQEWIKINSKFYKSNTPLGFDAKEGFPLLFEDLERYLRERGLYEIEKHIAEQYVLNPYSGEWIKYIKIVMAEMGLISYNGTIPRKSDAFTGLSDKTLLREYVISRLAFIQAMFNLNGICEVPLFRGMSSDIDLYDTPQTLVSTTFSAETASAFAGLNQESTSRSAYLVKFSCPVESLFMTFFETKELNRQYKEQEAVIFFDGQFKL